MKMNKTKLRKSIKEALSPGGAFTGGAVDERKEILDKFEEIGLPWDQNNPALAKFSDKDLMLMLQVARRGIKKAAVKENKMNKTQLKQIIKEEMRKLSQRKELPRQASQSH